MKPLNLDNRPCSPVSSNCVIWQGPDLPCIKLCAGDSISDVIAALATELCTIMDQLNVSNYDLTCLDLTTCGPKDFQELIQLLITKICDLNNIPASTEKALSGCPDCVVSVAPCFVVGTQTTMQLVEYVQAAASKICGILTEIDGLKNDISTINTTLVDLQYQIDNLPVYTLPSFAVDCLLGPGTHPLDTIVETLVNDDALGYCALITATGTPTEINAAVLSQCIADADQALAALPTVVSFSAYYGASWVANPALSTDPSLANAVNNAWVAICDIYNYVKTLGLTVTDTNTIDLTYAANNLKADVKDTGWVNLEGFDFMIAAKPQCRRIGNVIHFRGPVVVPIGDANDGGGGNIISWNSVDTYNTIQSGFTYNTIQAAGTGSSEACQLTSHTFGAWAPGTIGLQCKWNAGNSVLPTSIFGAGETLDTGYTQGTRTIATRIINISGSKNFPMHSVLVISIASTGQLIAATISTDENYNSATSGYPYSSILRNLISCNNAGDYVPVHTPTAPSHQNAHVTGGTYNPDLYGEALTFQFDQDAGRADQIAGFVFRLDGLTAFVDKCSGTPTFVNC